MQTGNCLQCMSKLQLLIDATIYKISQRDDKYNVQFELEWLRRVTNVYISNVNQDGIKSLMLLQNGKEKKKNKLMTAKNKELCSTMITFLCDCITCILGISYRRGSDHSIHKNVRKYNAGHRPNARGTSVCWPTLPLVKRLVAVQC